MRVTRQEIRVLQRRCTRHVTREEREVEMVARGPIMNRGEIVDTSDKQEGCLFVLFVKGRKSTRKVSALPRDIVLYNFDCPGAYLGQYA